MHYAHPLTKKFTIFAEINAPGAQLLEAITKHSKTHQKPLVLCTPPFEKSLSLVGAYFGVGLYFGKYGNFYITSREKTFSSFEGEEYRLCNLTSATQHMIIIVLPR